MDSPFLMHWNSRFTQEVNVYTPLTCLALSLVERWYIRQLLPLTKEIHFQKLFFTDDLVRIDYDDSLNFTQKKEKTVVYSQTTFFCVFLLFYFLFDNIQPIAESNSFICVRFCVLRNNNCYRTWWEFRLRFFNNFVFVCFVCL